MPESRRYMPARVSRVHVRVPLMSCNELYQGTQKPCLPVPEIKKKTKRKYMRGRSVTFL